MCDENAQGGSWQRQTLNPRPRDLTGRSGSLSFHKDCRWYRTEGPGEGCLYTTSNCYIVSQTSTSRHILCLVFFLKLCLITCGILVSQTGIKSMPFPTEAHSANHSTTRKVPSCTLHINFQEPAGHPTGTDLKRNIMSNDSGILGLVFHGLHFKTPEVTLKHSEDADTKDRRWVMVESW